VNLSPRPRPCYAGVCSAKLSVRNILRVGDVDASELLTFSKTVLTYELGLFVELFAYLHGV
jgi:hypothetical protein